MDEQLSEEDLKIIKENLIKSLYEQDCVKLDVQNNCPDYLKPYADINPFSEDAEDQIAQRMTIIHPEAIQRHPAWILPFIDKGLVDEDGKTVIAKSLNDVAAAILDNGVQVNSVLLKRFIDGKSVRHYSKPSIKAAITYAYSE